MNWFKQCFAPGLASYGATAYLTGNYVKAVARIEKSISWLPQINESPEFIGILGLSLIKIGKQHDAQPYLKMALENFNNIEPSENDETEFKQQLICDIENALRNNT